MFSRLCFAWQGKANRKFPLSLRLAGYFEFSVSMGALGGCDLFPGSATGAVITTLDLTWLYPPETEEPVGRIGLRGIAAMTRIVGFFRP